MRTLVIAIAVAGATLIFSTAASACPCSPCTCSPCTCGGMSKSSKPKQTKAAPPSNKPQTPKTEHGKTTTSKTSKSESYHKGKEGHGGHSSHTSFGASVDIDLSGIGQRKREPDPFAVSDPPPPARTQERTEKPKTKEKQHEIPKPDPFANVSLTGPPAKEASQSPGSINISDDTETPPTLPTQGVFKKEEPKQITIDDLKKTAEAYNAAWKKFLDPFIKKLISLTSALYPADAYDEAIETLRRQFAQTEDGKKLLDDWMKTYQAVNKSGAEISGDLVPPNKLEQAKHDLTKAQQAVDTQRDVYENAKKNAVANNPGVKSIKTEIDALKKQTHFSDAEVQADKDKLKKLQAELDNIKKQVADEWASSEEAKDQMKKVQEAEKNLDKAKEAYKPFEQFEEKSAKAAANP